MMDHSESHPLETRTAHGAVRARHELAAARQRLLDLTMRNPLLNYRQRKTRTIRVIDESPRELYDRLVLREKEMVFVPRAADEESLPAAADVAAADEDRSAAEQALLWRPPAPDEAADPKHIDRFLQTELDAEELQRRLFYVRQQARTVLREQGYTVHYLALGFLTWNDPQNRDEIRQAPLILVPVELQRTRVASTFKLIWSGDDVLTNISLQEKLAELQVVIPDFAMPEDKTGIDDYFMAVSEAVADHSGWRVTAEITLDFFSFTKFVMYKDLDPQAWPDGQAPTDHPLVKQVLDPQDLTPPVEFAVGDIDTTLDPRELYYVMDADPSQIGVIEAVKAGHNLVVEGPPGTGKSQTITNLIAELLAAGRSVLFVSEKMAALEVVKDRLDRVGIGDYCLELHSRKTRKKEVLRELERTLSLRAPRTIDTSAEFSRLADLTHDLNGYAEALRDPFGVIERSPYQFLEDIERCAQAFAGRGRQRPPVDLPKDSDCSPEQYEHALRSVLDLSDALQLVAPVRNHPWFGTDPQATLPPDEDEVAHHIADTIGAIIDVERQADVLVAATAMRHPSAPCDVAPALRAADLIARAPEVHVDILTHPDWDTPDTTGAPLIATVEAYAQQLNALTKVFVDDACTMDIVPLRDEYKQESARFLRFLSSRYRYLKREITMLYRGAAPPSIERRISDLGQLVDLDRARRAVVDSGPQGRALFGALWRDEHSNPAELQAFCAWMSAVRQAHRSGVITTATLRLICTDLDRAAVTMCHDHFSAATASFEEHYERLNERLSVDHALIFDCQPDAVELATLRGWLEKLGNARDSIQRWSQFRARHERCRATIADGISQMVLHKDVVAEDLAPAFEAAFAESVLRRALAARPVLGEFVGELHENKRERFATLDRQLIHSNRQRLARRLYERRPRVQSGAPAGSEVGIIQGEFNRKRGHMPIRRLLSRAGRLIQKIKPCFMMSPLSIAQYLDPRTARFDVVIFDEASQVRPEDALGALLRGAQLVVMGDTRQLPPTSFFDHLADAAELDDESTSVAEVESILHQCKRSFGTRSLRWHYRSRHQSLIAVSNQEFYDNRLNIYPSPIDHDDYLGLQFNHLSDTVYDRGKSGVNRGEARAVVATAMDLFRRYPHKSVGVGAFNIRQQQAILEEVELQLKQHPELEDHFAEDRIDEFFVKNLETIQGDERDIILISVGFGFDGNGKLSHNFGPLNQEGGERRLNVLITRARERCEVFCNFTAEDLAIDSGSPFGLRALHTFMDFARRRHLRTIDTESATAASNFEGGITSFLRHAGYDVRSQIGCASYRVDLGVVDPQDGGRFLLGIECDGPRYHEADVARDRERLRAQVMEGLGWNLHRMWALDWYRNRQHSQRRLHARLDELRERHDDARATYARPKIEAVQYEEHTAVDPEADNEVDVEPYVACPRRGEWDVERDLHDYAAPELGAIIANVVDVEGPIHVEEVTRRLREWWDLSRAGARVRSAIESGIIEAVGDARVRRDRDDFLWALPERPPIVRRRTGNPPARLELICDEEIAAAAERVLDLYHAALPDALARQVARCFGIKAVSTTVSDRVQRVVQDAVDGGRLVQLTNGMLDLAER